MSAAVTVAVKYADLGSTSCRGLTQFTGYSPWLTASEPTGMAADALIGTLRARRTITARGRPVAVQAER